MAEAEIAGRLTSPTRLVVRYVCEGVKVSVIYTSQLPTSQVSGDIYTYIEITTTSPSTWFAGDKETMWAL